MQPLTSRTVVYLAIDIALLVMCILHAPSLLHRARAPFDADMVNGHVQVVRVLDQEAAGTVIAGDRIIQWNDVPVAFDNQIEFLGDFRLPGDAATLTLEDGRRATITCIPYHDTLYVVIALLVGTVTWALGVFVLLSSQGELAARTLHWSLICMGVSTIMTYGRTPPGEFIAYLSRGIFFIVYQGVTSFFLLFTMLFPRPKRGPLWAKIVASFLPAVTVLPILLVTYFRALDGQSPPAYTTFQHWFNIFHVVLLVYVGVGLVHVIRSYTAAESTAERKKLEWIMWGLTIGPTPFLFLVVLPELFRPTGFIDEEIAYLFFLAIPASFAISFVKYRLLDIEVVIKRTTVYAAVLGAVVTLYALAVSSVSALVGSYVPVVGAAAAAGVALLFEPVRLLVQRWVDRRFFRVRYNFREAGRSILEDIERAVDEVQLGGIVIRRTEDIIPVERIACLVASIPGGRLQLLSQEGMETGGGAGELLGQWSDPRQPAGLRGIFEAGVPYAPLDPAAAVPHGVAAAFPMLDENQTLLGCIGVGPKKSGARFTAEDADLLMQVAAETGLAMQRIRLQRRLLLEQAAARRLEELNRMKSDFVSYVSHELRTPLTSIKMFTEILRSPRMRLGRAARGHVRIIEGEAERLGRMVTTILDSARIERGEKEYHPLPGDLKTMVRDALGAMEFQLKQNRFTVGVVQPRRQLPVCADSDAVMQAVMNLVANSIKYSGAQKYLKVTLARRGEWITCSIQDRGRGIPSAALPHVFERFYRVPETSREITGVGLGLPLVKNIMTAHGGTVEVSSVVGKGSTFTLVFPEAPHEHNPGH